MSSEQSDTDQIVTDEYGTPAPAYLDGVDLSAVDECPVCLSSDGWLCKHSPGHYHCTECNTWWEGYPRHASLLEYNAPGIAND